MSQPVGETYDAVVLGVGGWGSAALYHLARRGLKVCGVEQYDVGHDCGSSHGDSRIIRMAYFMHPDYVPVLRRAYELWRALEAESGERLMTLNGLLCWGEPGSAFIQGLERCYATHEIEHEKLSRAETQERFPQFHLPEDAECYFDPFGGFLRPEVCVQAHLHGALAAGATLIAGEPVLAMTQESSGVTIQTTRQQLGARKVIVAAGAFTNRMLRAFGSSPVQIRRKVLFWYRTTVGASFAPEDFPAWIAKLGGLNFYGFPTLDGALVKAAEDTGGQQIESPEVADRELRPEDESRLRPFLEQTFPGRMKGRARFKTCLYEESVDRHFIVDVHPRAPDVIVIAGGSGHGFKFCPVIGEMAADLAQSKRCELRPAIFTARGRL